MIKIGDKSRFAFVVGDFHEGLRVVSIFIGGREVTGEDHFVYLPAYINSLKRQADKLKNTLNYLKYERLFRDIPIEDVHKIHVSENLDLFRDDTECYEVIDYHSFMRLGDPTMESFSAFLIPYYSRMILSCEIRSESKPFYVDSVLPFDLLYVIEDAINKLSC